MNRIFSLLITSFIICFGNIRYVHWPGQSDHKTGSQLMLKYILGPLELYHFLIAQGTVWTRDRWTSSYGWHHWCPRSTVRFWRHLWKHREGISVEQPYCKILDFLRLTLPWTHPILNPVFYSFIGAWIHWPSNPPKTTSKRFWARTVMSMNTNMLQLPAPSLHVVVNTCKGRQFRQNLLKYKNQRVSTFENLDWCVPKSFGPKPCSTC